VKQLESWLPNTRLFGKLNILVQISPTCMPNFAPSIVINLLEDMQFFYRVYFLQLTVRCIVYRTPSKSWLCLWQLAQLSFTYLFSIQWTEWTRHWTSRASSDAVSLTFTYHTWQFIFSLHLLSPLSSSLTRSVFHSELKTWLFGKSFPP